MRKRSLWWLSQTTVMTVERTVAACRTGSSRGSSDKRCPKPNLHRHSLTTTPLCVCACVPYMLYDGGGVLAWHHSVCEWCCLECEAAFLKVEESVLWFSNLNIWLFSAVCLFFLCFFKFLPGTANWPVLWLTELQQLWLLTQCLWSVFKVKQPNHGQGLQISLGYKPFMQHICAMLLSPVTIFLVVAWN